MKKTNTRLSNRLTDTEYIFLLEKEIIRLKKELEKKDKEYNKLLDDILKHQKETTGKMFSALLNHVEK